MNLGYKQGFYIFGGVDERAVLHNDLWLIEPDYEYNKYNICGSKCTYSSKLEVGLTLKKIDNFSGMPPCPRFSFSMTNL